MRITRERSEPRPAAVAPACLTPEGARPLVELYLESMRELLEQLRQEQAFFAQAAEMRGAQIAQIEAAVGLGTDLLADLMASGAAAEGSDSAVAIPGGYGNA